MEVDDTLHADVREVWQVEHETSHDVEHDPQLVGAVVRQQIDKHVGEATHRCVSQRKVLEKDKNAGYQAEEDAENLDGPQSSELHTLRPVENLLL